MLPLIAPLVNRWKTLLAVYAIFVLSLLFVWPGASFFGGAALRVLGIGGGIPVSILVRVTQPGDSQPTTIERLGCLVLEMGGDILIKPMADIHDCKLNRKFGLGNEWESTYTGVERYSRSDIGHRGFPSREDTVDGLPVLENAKRQ